MKLLILFIEKVRPKLNRLFCKEFPANTGTKKMHTLVGSLSDLTFKYGALDTETEKHTYFDIGRRGLCC